MAASKTRSTVRIQMVTLGFISVTLSLVSGLFLLWYGLSVEASQPAGATGGPGAEVLAAFAMTGVGALLTAFGLFAAGSSIVLVSLLDGQEKAAEG